MKNLGLALLLLTSSLTAQVQIGRNVQIGGNSGGGVCTNCVVTNPAASVSQAITQQDETQFSITAPLISLNGVSDTGDGEGGSVQITSTSNSAVSSTGNIAILSQNTSTASLSGNIALDSNSVSGSPQSGNIALNASSTNGGDQSGNIGISAHFAGSNASIGSGDVEILATGPSSTTVNQGRISSVATNYISFQGGHNQYHFGGPSSTGNNGGPLTGFGVLDFSNMPNGSNNVFTFPNSSGTICTTTSGCPVGSFTQTISMGPSISTLAAGTCASFTPPVVAPTPGSLSRLVISMASNTTPDGIQPFAKMVGSPLATLKVGLCNFTGSSYTPTVTDVANFGFF